MNNVSEVNNMRTTTTQRRPQMKVKRDEAVVLFVALGFKNAGEWKMTRMLGKIKSLPDTPNIDNKLSKNKNKKLKVLCSKLITAVEAGEDIILTKGKKVGKKSEKTKKGTKAKKGKKGTKTKKGTEDTATKKKRAPKAEPDAFGSRIGTSGSAINLVFIKAPKKVQLLRASQKRLVLS